LGSFAKLRKATTSFVMSVRPPLLPHGTSRLPLDGFSWNLMFEYFSTLSKENLRSIKVLPKQRVIYMKTISRSILLRMRNVSDKIRRENQNTFCVQYLFQRTLNFCDNVWKYVTAGQATDEGIIRRMRFACFVNKVTNTHSVYVILNAFPLQQWLHERVSILRYIHCRPF